MGVFTVSCVCKCRVATSLFVRRSTWRRASVSGWSGGGGVGVGGMGCGDAWVNSLHGMFKCTQVYMYIYINQSVACNLIHSVILFLAPDKAK